MIDGLDGVSCDSRSTDAASASRSAIHSRNRAETSPPRLSYGASIDRVQGDILPHLEPGLRMRLLGGRGTLARTRDLDNLELQQTQIDAVRDEQLE
jgi:hypothetical protein